jgi:photosystem II stability/assembly factor-like uncharacterized protein
VWAVQPTGTGRDFHGIKALDAQTAIAVGDDGEIRSTTDGGAHWLLEPIQDNPHLWGVD